MEAAKADQVAAELEAQGYEVIREPQGAQRGYDLIAVKDGKTIAVEVKARSTLRESSEEIRRLRERALELGYSEFRLIVANPPREKTIKINGLDRILADYLIDQEFPQELYDIAPQPYIEGVSDVEVNMVNIAEDEIRVLGTGLVNVRLEWGGGESDNGMTWDTDFPFTFDVVLNSDLNVEAAHTISVDTSSFYE